MSNPSTPTHIAIIGGGIIGTASAWYLSNAGIKVTVIEKDSISSGCSYENCGYVCPSHALPLTQPGAIGSTLKAMLKSGSPLYVNPLAGPSLWTWLIRFAGNCNHDHMIKAGTARNALLQSSKSLYKDLVSKGLECEMTDKGLLVVYSDEKGLEHAHKENDILNTNWGVRATPYDGQGLCDLEPAIKPGLAGAMHFECDSHLNPSLLMDNWTTMNRTQGVVYMENCTVRGFIKESGNITALDTSMGAVEADAFVLATGALGPLLAKELGHRLHIQPGKGYSITTTRPTQCPEIPMIFHDHRVAVTPFKDAYRIGSTMEFSGYDTSLNRRRLNLLESGAAHYLHEPRGEKTLSEWYGWRPMNATGIPTICKSPLHSNILMAVGHSMLGTSMGPATGKLIMELATGQEPHIDAAPYQ